MQYFKKQSLHFLRIFNRNIQLDVIKSCEGMVYENHGTQIVLDQLKINKKKILFADVYSLGKKKLNKKGSTKEN